MTDALKSAVTLAIARVDMVGILPQHAKMAEAAIAAVAGAASATADELRMIVLEAIARADNVKPGMLPNAMADDAIAVIATSVAVPRRPTATGAKPFTCAYGDSFGIEAKAGLGDIDIRTAPDAITTLSIADARALAAWLYAAADLEEAATRAGDTLPA